jgi:hypothetical protein
MARLAIGYRRRPGQGAHKCRGAGRPPKYSRSGPGRKDNGTTSQPLPASMTTLSTLVIFGCRERQAGAGFL